MAYNNTYDYVPEEGFIPDEIVATNIARILFYHEYGKECIDKEMPLRIRLYKNTWIIESSIPKGYIGGVAHLEIQKSDGKIIALYHSK